MPPGNPQHGISGIFTRFHENRAIALIGLALVLVATAVYWPVLGFGFVNLDDPSIIYDNSMVTNGWTLRGFFWSLTTSYFEYWHPITWMSHMTDCQFFGVSAGWHHLTSLAIHLANTLLLFAVLLEMTGFKMRSAMVAALFALHPMHVESVAWLSERKDLLSTLFWLLSVWAYVRYFKALRATSARSNLFHRLSLLFFVFGLMSKPMVVTLPFVLLLLDFWPLGRISNFRFQISNSTADSIPGGAQKPFLNLVREKAPFFGLALLSCVITFSNVKAANNVLSAAVVPWSLRLTNVPVSYARYLAKLAWPVNLSVQYPLPDHWENWRVALSVLLILAISAVAVAKVRAAPYWLFGWCFFLGTLVPTISLVPVGFQSMADRYTYLPYIGLFVAGVWGVAEFAGRGRGRIIVLAAAAGALAACAVVSRAQIGYWRNGETLFRRVIAVTPDHTLSRYGLGNALLKEGKLAEAMLQLQAALKLMPNNPLALNDVGFILDQQGRYQEAVGRYEAALKANPNYAPAHYNLGGLLQRSGHLDEAIEQFQAAVRLTPEDPDAHNNLGTALAAKGQNDQAVVEFAEAVRLKPSDSEARFNLGIVLLGKGRNEEAVRQFQAFTNQQPDNADGHYELGVALLGTGRRQEAVAELEQALKLRPDFPNAAKVMRYLTGPATR